jgi:hypothetical protein
MNWLRQRRARVTYIEDRLDANRQCHPGHLGQVIAKEARVCENSVVCKGLYTCARLEAGTRFIEGNVAVRPNAAQKELNAADTGYLVLVGPAFVLEVSGVAVEDVDVGWLDVDVGEEVLVHEAVIAFWMISRDAHILVLERVSSRPNAMFLCNTVTRRRKGEAVARCRGDSLCTILKVTTLRNDMSPALCRWTRRW